MNTKQIIAAIAQDAAVVEAQTRTVGGVPQAPAGPDVEAAAKVGLRMALSQILLDPANKRKLFTRSYDITTTSGTDEYTLQGDVGRILDMRTGDDDLPLKPFEDLAQFDRWYARHWGGVTISDTAAPQAYYISDRSATRINKVTFVPGVGAETTIKVRYEKNPKTPLSTAELPDCYHDALVIGGINFASGGKYADLWASVKVDVRAGLDIVVGGPGEIQKSDWVRRITRRHNLMVGSGYSSSHLYYPPLS